MIPKKMKKPKPGYEMEIKGESEKWYWKTINMLKPSSRPLLLFSESLSNLSHLCDPQSHSFIWSDRDSKHPLPMIVLQSALLIAHTHTHASQFLSSFGRVNDPTPVLSDTCSELLANQTGEGNSVQTWNKSGPVQRESQHLTHLCVSALLY